MSQPTRILLALVVGIALGILSASAGGGWVDDAISVAEPIGGLWLDSLRMTIVPLVVSLLITGLAASAAAARANRLAGRSFVLFIILLWTSSALAALLTPLFLDLFPLPSEAAAALRGALSATEPVGDVPPFSAFFRSLVPTNPIAAAAEDAILPLIVFTTLFAVALGRLPAERRELIISFFQSIADVMLVIIGWILWLAPIGVFALAFVVGARAGGAAFGALLHYILIVSAVGAAVWLLAYPIARFGARKPLGDFARAVAPAQAVAISTQSSLASLPAMLTSAGRLHVPVAASGVVLPLAVAIFRVTGPAMNLAVVLYVAHWFGVPLGPGQIAAGIAAAAITTMGAVSLPGQVSFITSIAPIAIVVGVPIEPLALLIAVETVPDLVRTLGNVTMNVAVTAAVSERSGFSDAERGESDQMLEESIE